MESSIDMLTRRLQDRSYRQLQQMAKALNLPSNFKKVNLIELILAKKFRHETDVSRIINRCRQERLHLTKVNKKKRMYQDRAQWSPEARNSTSFSPPITVTPKRPSKINMQYNQDVILQKPLVPINPRRNLLSNIPSNRNSNTVAKAVSVSDRVLRSYNMKAVKPNYALINNNILELKTQCCSNTEAKFKIITQGGFNVKTKYYRKTNNNMELGDHSRAIFKKQYYIARGGEIIRTTVPAKRQRTISGIYPLHSEEIIPRNLSTNPSVGFRNTDGSFTKINAFVQKRNVTAPKKSNYNTKSAEITLQEIIFDQLDVNLPEDLTNLNNNNLDIQYSNISGIDPTPSNLNIVVTNNQVLINDNYKENVSLSTMQHIDYEEKIREEQLRCARLMNMQSHSLPTIHEAFTRFRQMHRRDVTQPIYVQVGSEPYSVPSYSNNEKCIPTNPKLETLYNFKTTAPLEWKKKAETKCVDALKTMPTAFVVEASAVADDSALHFTSPVQDSDQYPDVEICLREFLQLQPSRRHTDHFSSSSSLDTMATTASIPEMVEDALEIISQDGDYMERMGMSAQTQCVFCGWAGPTIMLECHIRKDHANSIHAEQKSEWNITYTLGSLVQCGEWLHRVVEHDSLLYMLSAKYEEPGCFMATLSSLSTGPESTEKYVLITLFNKITGQPYAWTSQIQTLPTDWLCDNNCFKIDLAKLDLLPNSANLKLVNGELVTQSLSKVVVGQTALNDIHIIVFVKIYNN